MAEITEDNPNSFLNYSDLNNPANVLADYLQDNYEPDEIDWSNFAEINEYCSEFVEDEDF